MSRTITWSGHEWRVRLSESPTTPGNNLFSDSENSVRLVDGKLSLAITEYQEVWHSAEVSLTETLGYGTYTCTLETPIAEIPSDAVLGVFLYAHDKEEADFEISPSMVGHGLVQLAIQPARIWNRRRLKVPESIPLRFSFSWSDVSISYEIATLSGEVLHAWQKKYYISPDRGRFIINYWLFGSKRVHKDSAISLTDFSFSRMHKAINILHSLTKEYASQKQSKRD